jgi:glucokinase
MFEQRQNQYAIGVDVGGTNCAAGIVALADGRVVGRRRLPTRAGRGGEAVHADVVGMVGQLRNEQPLGRVATKIGIGVAELVGTNGRVLSEATIHWREMDVAKEIRDATGLPAVVDADVRAAARGEAHFGSGRKFANFLYVTVGTGISACLVLGKLPFCGLAGTFASSPGLMPGDGEELLSGPPLEQFAAGPALAARFAAVRSDFRGAAPEVLALADAGDPFARNVVVSGGRALGAAIAHLVNVVDPEAVVLGGGLGLADGLFRRSLDDALREHVWSDLHRDIPLLPAELGHDAGVIGAALGTAIAAAT